MSPSCQYCGSGSTRLIFHVQHSELQRSTFFECGNCHVYFLHPLPSTEQLQKAYDEHYYGVQNRKFTPGVQWIREAALHGRIRQFQKLIQQPAHVLDIGCGDGSFLQALSRRGNFVCGTELPGKAADRAAAVPELKLHLEPITSHTFPPDSFDAIYLWHVFEHLQSPLEYLDWISKWLRPNGFLILALPNSRSWQSRLFRGYWFHLDPPRHISLPPFEAILAQARTRGFVLHSCNTLSLEQNIFGYLQSFLNLLWPQRDILYDWLKGNSRLSAAILGQLLLTLSFCPFAIALTLLEAGRNAGGVLELVFKKSEASLLSD